MCESEGRWRRGTPVSGSIRYRAELMLLDMNSYTDSKLLSEHTENGIFLLKERRALIRMCPKIHVKKYVLHGNLHVHVHVSM